MSGRIFRFISLSAGSIHEKWEILIDIAWNKGRCKGCSTRLKPYLYFILTERMTNRSKLKLRLESDKST